MLWVACLSSAWAFMPRGTLDKHMHIEMSPTSQTCRGCEDLECDSIGRVTLDDERQ